ncbi:MFS transporter [Saccharopolyspora aridisoli]|uniref:MFS transporter n=1 Tax=Saccharopolyspora aridisoli TaxID=2530385 RepID=A0A4R4UWY3_9PSEU|nr:aromatic acid/H+ symport family MFS transporter [Saccharopolyspora aridisoli]TDC96711.1 MFS transporter [Saccharopolyspora aridisoli]
MSETDSTMRRRQRTVSWVVALSTIVLVFDGYDLVVYGTVLPTLLKDPTQLGAITPGQAGTLGSYALIGVLVGALVAGSLGDLIGRRRIMLINLAWFSIGMGATALTQNVAAFGIGRFFTGIGVGALVATVGPLVAEFADPGRRNRLNAIVYSGVPAGGVLAGLLALVLDDVVGWRGLFWIGALPIVLVLPLAVVKLPESPKWLASRGRFEQAKALAERTGIELRAEPVAPAATTRSGFPALASKDLAWPTALLGLMSFAGLLLTYGLNTWLPQIMANNGYDKTYSLAFLLVLNLGAIVGGLFASLWADRAGAKRVVATTFVLAACTLALLPMELPLIVLLFAVAVAGIGTIGTQVLIYGLVSNYYPTRARAAGVAWCAGFGRIGGIVGPVVGGLLVGAGLGGTTAFYLFAAVAAGAAVVTLLVPRSRDEDEAERPLAAAAVGSPNPA